jgi:hypothetical protein
MYPGGCHGCMSETRKMIFLCQRHRNLTPFGDKEMVVDHYNPMGSEKFRKNDNVKVTVPRSSHVLKR